MWEFIDKILYINLDHREDRRQVMKTFFEKGQVPSEKIQRISGIHRMKGYIGCLESHTRALQIAKENGWKNVLILEDDLEWLDFEKGYEELQKLVSLPTWDVIQLVGWYVEYDFPRIYNTMNAGAYIVNGHYYDNLLANRYESLHQMRSFHMLYKSPIPYTADVYWNKLAKKDHWYGLYPCICRQMNTYSDNSKCIYNASGVHGIFKGKGNLFEPIQNAQ